VTTKSDFNAEEWSTIVEGPVLAGMRVVAAGRGGTIRESLAIGKVYGEARQSQGANELLDELVAAPPAVDPQKLQGAKDLSAVAGERVQEALRLLEAKATPDDTESYKQFVVSVARAAAEAHKEGGFIGIGGRQISDEEQVALDELGELLR
jgi:hypothetical protein